MRIALLPLLILTATLAAQDLLPELAPLAKKFDEDSAAVADQRTAAIAPLKQQYLAALDLAEKAARAAVQVPAVSAIFAERQAVTHDTMAPAVPPDLPKSLQPARKTYADALSRVTLDYTARQQRLDTAYLSRLDFLPGKTKPALTEQIAAEKERVISTAMAASGGAVHAGNLLVNGNFAKKDENDQPAGWKAYQGKGSLEVENGNAFYRQTNYDIEQRVPIPPNSHEATVSLRMRTPDAAECGYSINCVKTDGSTELVFGTSYTKVPEKWKAYTQKGRIPKGAVALRCQISARKGTGDFDDVVLEAK